MTTKERLHELVDELNEAEANDALRYIASRRTNEAPDGGAYPAVMPSFGGRPATSEELQALLGGIPTDGEG
jgi:hypothetical protein